MNFEEPHLATALPLRLPDLADFSPVVEGARYISRDGPRRVTVFAKAGIGLLGTAWVLFPIMGARIFPLTSLQNSPARGAMLSMSLLMTARGLGALIGPLASAPWVKQDEGRLRLGILLGFLIGGLGYLALAGAPTLPLACATVVLAHAGAASVWVHSTTLLQLHTEDAFRGRVFAAELGFCMLSIAVSAAIADGTMSASVGTVFEFT